MTNRLFACVATGMISLGLAYGPASAADSPNGDTYSSAMLSAYAESVGIPVGDAADRIKQEDAISDSVDNVTSDYGSAAFDSWLDNGAQGIVLHIRTLNDNIAQVLTANARRAGVRVEWDESPALVVRRTAEVAARLGPVDQTASGLMGYYIEVADGSLVLDVESQGEAAELLLKAASDYTPRVNEVGKAGDSANVNGGSTMTNCTMGFMATYTSGSTTYQGFITAAHCGKSVQYYYNTAGTGTLKSATYRTQNYGANADIAFHSVASGDLAGYGFYGSSSSSPTIQGDPSTVAVGSTVCRRGKAIGYDCGPVESITYTPTWDNACPNTTCNPVFVRTTQTTHGGDSGGPVWKGSAAPVGIHKGGSAGGIGGIGQYSVYSKIGYRPSGVAIK